MKAKNKIVHYFSLEDPEILFNIDQHPDNLFKYFNLDSQARTFVLIDEIQYLDDPSNFLKLIFDKYSSKLKLVVTGSSAFYIDKKFKDSLAGRKRIFNLYTLDFDEFIYFKAKSTQLLDELSIIRTNKDFISIDRRELTLLFKEYLTYGGYPAVVLTNSEDRKKLLLKDLVSSYSVDPPISHKYKEGAIKNEVDFVIDNPGVVEKEAFEIKFNINSFNKNKFKKFINTYPEIKLNLRAFLATDNSTGLMAL